MRSPDSDIRQPLSESLVFTRHNGRFKLARQPSLKNNLLASVGLLELANAGDFAANVWNEIPLPHFAIVLMAIGGTVALLVLCFAVRDAQLSRRNALLLWNERRHLQKQRAHHIDDQHLVRDLDGQLDVNFREIGTELVDRVGMDALMGFGAVLVGVGTYMAIGGANPYVYRASNLLSGYVGNSLPALWGVANAAWSTYVWRRARRHGIAGAEELKGEVAGHLLKSRTDTVKMHAALSGLTGIVAGAASLMTATRWWGYVILIPCIISSVYLNYLFRRRIGYDRPIVRHIPRANKSSLVEELSFTMIVQKTLEGTPSGSLDKVVGDPASISSVIELIVKCDLFEDFCIRLLEDTTLSKTLFGSSSEELAVDSQSLLAVDDLPVPRLLEIAQSCLSEMGRRRLEDRKRVLLERLGCYLCHPAVDTPPSEKPSESAEALPLQVAGPL